MAIKVRNVSKKYSLRHPITDSDGVVTQEHWALKDVSFDVKMGESVGIIGPNGSGKSTLLKIISGITKPTSGEVEISGRVASILDIGAGFHTELSGRENIFLNGQLLGFSRNEIEEKYKEIVAFSEIENFIEEPVKHYSNGMYLRLAFSILAHLDFDIYLFDEVMGVGDAEFRDKITKFFNFNKTILLVSHNEQEIQNHTDRVITLKNGLISQSEQTSYFTEHIDYSKNTILFDGGIISISRYEDGDYAYFEISTTFDDPHLNEKKWSIHMKDQKDLTIMAYLGHEDEAVYYPAPNQSVHCFKLNQSLFRAGNYSLSFFLTDDGKYTHTKPKERYHFMLENHAMVNGYACQNCGPIFYPNTLNRS